MLCSVVLSRLYLFILCFLFHANNNSNKKDNNNTEQEEEDLYRKHLYKTVQNAFFQHKKQNLQQYGLRNTHARVYDKKEAKSELNKPHWCTIKYVYTLGIQGTGTCHFFVLLF